MGAWMTWSPATKNRSIFLGATLLVVILGVFAFENTQTEAASDQRQSQIFAIQQAQDNTRISLSRVYVTLTRYVTTGSPADLQNYGSARSRLLGDVAALARQLNDESNQTAYLIPLVIVNVIWADGVALLRSFGLGTIAARISAGGPPRSLADHTTRVFDTLHTDAIQTITRLSAESATSSQYALIMTIVRTVVMVGLLGISYYFLERDLQVHTQYEQRLKEERTLLRTVIDVLPVNIYVKNPALQFVLMNRSQAGLIGTPSPDAMIGKRDADFFPAEMVARYARDEQAIFRTGTPLLEREEPSITPDGRELVMLTNKMPVRDETGVVSMIVGVSQDITARKAAEKQIKQLHENARLHAEQLEQINKELEAFSYTISHDLRAPLRAIDGFSRIVMNEYASDLPAEAQRYLERVRINAQRMGNLIDDLLQFARVSRQTLNMEKVEPGELVAQILDDELHVEREARPVAIEIGELPACKADPLLLRQVYVNLLSNAFKFSSKRDQPRIEIGAKREDGGVIYFVRDNGTGFDDQYIDKLFGVFQRLHRQEDFDGTGAGLAIVQRVINRHGGRVWAESGIDRGATFYFTLGETYGS